MSVTIELSNPANLLRVKHLTGAKTDEDAVELVLDKYLKAHEPSEGPKVPSELPDEYWDDLFSDPVLPDSASVTRALVENREDRF